MNSNLIAQNEGFLKFISRAANELRLWFGPHCNNEPSKIAFMAAREWEAMHDHERKHFIKAQIIEYRQSGPRSPTGTNAFLCYSLEKKFAELPEGHQSDQTFNPKLGKSLGESWRNLSEDERRKYSNIKVSDVGIDLVLQKRTKLHEIYHPRELSILEFIIKTRPRSTFSPRMWFYSNENLSINSEEARNRWLHLCEEKKNIYIKSCMLDKKRFVFEKSAWLTNLLKVDFDSDNFTLKDFEIPDNMTRLEKIGSMIELSKHIPEPLLRLKKHRAPFSLFIEDYRYQIRDERPEFQFARHLRECSEVWSRLSDAEKQYYKDASKKLKETKDRLIKDELEAIQNKYTNPLNYLKLSKKAHGPCRPSHLTASAPKALSLWAEANKIVGPKSLLWQNLTPADKEPYEKEEERLRNIAKINREKIRQKLVYIKGLIRRARELEKLKRKLGLISVCRQ